MDKTVVEGIQEGDATAFKLLFDTYYASLCEYAVSFVRLTPVAEDLVQDVFANIWNMRENWSPNHTIKSYLFRAVRNQALNYIKHDKLEKSWAEQVRQNSDQDLVFDPEVSDHSDLEKTIYQAIDDLPPRRCAVFVLSRFYHLTYVEIADALDISVKTVEKHIRIALMQLYEEIFGD
ncbi:MAG TPA: RNA polymerase sigma-70 factor [Balneolales bacterium]|nr:RNA polymerase sigma-70 factor [Balneolales bacterium]